MVEKLLIDQSLQNIKFIFRLAGLNIDNTERSHKQTFIFLFNFLWHENDVISGLLWVIVGMFNGKGFTELTYVMPCIIFGILADIKSVFFLFKESKVHKLMESLRDSEIRANGFEIPERYELIKSDIQFLNVIIKVFNIVYSMMFIVFAVFPLIFIGVKYLVTGQVELLLPFLDLYTYFDAFDPKYWPFVYAHQFWSAIIALIDVCAIDYFLYTCCTHITLQLKLLQHQFEEMITTDNVHEEGTILPVFRNLIKWHQKIISAANLLEDIYSKTTLCNFLASSLMICLTGFNVTIVDDKAVIVTFVIFLSMSMVQVFFLCFFGDILMSSSMNVAISVYNSEWYLKNANMGRNLLIVQIRAQNPCKLTASGFADVNLMAFMRILSTSWSYFALLQTIYVAHTDKI